MDYKLRDLIKVSPEELFDDLPEVPDECCDYCGDCGPLVQFKIEGTIMDICEQCNKNQDMDVSMFNVNPRNYEDQRRNL